MTKKKTDYTTICFSKKNLKILKDVADGRPYERVIMRLIKQSKKKS